MAVITFYSNETKETGQTLSTVAIAAHMSIEHNCKILIISTDFDDLTLENCFWQYDKIRTSGVFKTDGQTVGIGSGVESLIKVLPTSKNDNEVVKNYSRVVLKDRLDVLLSPTAKSYQEYATITPYYKEIISSANQYYDYVFVDLNKKMPKQDADDILKNSNIVMMNLTQRLKTINDFLKLRETNDFYKRKNVMLVIGKYDQFSKYNDKNVTRFLKEKTRLLTIPYNTLFFEACSEGDVIDFFLKIRKITDSTDKNMYFAKSIKNIDENIIGKLQELQMKM